MSDGAGRGTRGAGRASGGRSEDGQRSDDDARAPRPAPLPPRLAVLLDDLAFFSGDAIARPVSAELAATTALGRRLETAALDGERGAALARQLGSPGAEGREPLAVGAAVVTGAGALGVELLVHAVVRSRDERVTRDTVRRATTSALQRAADFQVEHLGLPPFGLGAGNLDPDDAAEAMADAIVRHLERAAWPRRVTVVVETEDERRAFGARLGAPGT